MRKPNNFTKLSAVMNEFMDDQKVVIRYIPAPGEYSGLNSATNSFRAYIRKHNLPIAVRKINNCVYLIRTDYVETRPISCFTCRHAGDCEGWCWDCGTEHTNWEARHSYE